MVSFYMGHVFAIFCPLNQITVRTTPYLYYHLFITYIFSLLQLAKGLFRPYHDPAEDYLTGTAQYVLGSLPSFDTIFTDRLVIKDTGYHSISFI